MPKHLHSPFRASLRSESKKAARILEEFINPSLTGRPAASIPSDVLENAKGFLIFTVFRAGFLGSGRIGTGVIVVRLNDGSWSPPLAITLAGGGFGGLIGIELTDFVFILNDKYAVQTFLQKGSLMLGMNVSLAMGPVGRTFEVQGGASLKGAAAIFAYSKTKGLYAGVSVEGGLVVESSHANMKMYHRNVTAKELLSGEITPPPEVEPLLRVLALDIFHPPKNQRSLDMVSGSRELPAMVENRSQSWVQSQPRLAELNAGAENQPPSEVHSESRLPAELHAESREPEIFELPAESNEVSTTVDPRRESNRDLTRVRRKPTATSSASGSQEETDQTSPDEARGGSEGPSMAVEPLDDSNQVSTAVERREESKGVDSHESNRTSPCCG